MTKKSSVLACLTLAATLSLPSSAFADYECSFTGFNEQIGDFTTQYPVNSDWGVRASYQYAYFLGAEGLKILQNYRSCLSDADFAANYQALVNSRDTGRDSCAKVSSDGACSPTYPGN